MSDMLPAINGIQYPSNVQNLESLKGWIAGIDRPHLTSNTRTFPIGHGEVTEHQEVYHLAPFFKGDAASEAVAEMLCCQYVAMRMYVDLIKVPNGALIIRVPVETDIGLPGPIPASLSLIKNRAVLEKEGALKGNHPVALESVLPDDTWTVDFMTDSIMKKAEGSDNLRWFKIYTRYSCAVVANQEQAA